MDEKNRKYQQAGLGRRVGFGERPAIVVVDFNKGCTHPESPLPPLMNLDREIAATRQLIDLSRGSDVLIVYTTLGPYREDLQDIGPLGHKVPGLRIFTAGSKWAEIDERLEVCPQDYVVWKKWQSSFFGTDLLSILVHQRIDTVIVTGCVTSGCVRATVVDACTHGFRVIVPRDCVGDRTAEIHEANLFDMNAKNADVISVSEVEAWFRNRAPLSANPLGGARSTAAA
jgi:nicotinamidase-related amidase